MDVKIIKQEHNPLLKRKEVWFEVLHEKKPTPAKLEVAQVLAAKLNAKIDLMIIKHYTTGYGTNHTRGLCIVYDSEGAMKVAEPLKKLNSKKRVGEKKKEGKENEAQAQ